MPNVAIVKVRRKSPSVPFMLKIGVDRVRERVFAIFRHRESSAAIASEERLPTERELTFFGETDMVEKDANFRLGIALPGFAERDVLASHRSPSRHRGTAELDRWERRGECLLFRIRREKAFPENRLCSGHRSR